MVAWTRADFDLDDPSGVGRLVTQSRADVVVHTAAWTDVDGCAREPDLAMHRNGEATTQLSEACARAGSALVVVSTNEVFAGTRTDGEGYKPADQTEPGNPYGSSKLAGERGALRAFAARPSQLGIVRTAWLFGSGKPDFPARIAAVARAAAAEGRAMRLVRDEVGQPTYVPDLADAIVRLLVAGHGGIHHVVNAGIASRAEWARDVLRRLEIDVATEDISLAEHPRPSQPPRWGVLEPTSLPGGRLRDWREAMDDRMALAGLVP